MRSLFWATALVVTSSVAVAQPPPQPEVKDGKRVVPIEPHVDKRVAQPPPEVKDGKQVFAITLSPMAAPKPLSNYYLTPQYKEQQPGDQLSGFMKCFMEQAVFFNAENEAKRQKLLEMSLADLSPRDFEGSGITDGIAYQPKCATLMSNIDLAARYTRTEWNEYFLFRKDGIYTLLPEVQSMRRLALALHLRLRAEVKQGEFDRAIVTVKSLMGLARMFESHPTTISHLVGIAVQAMAWNGVEEMIAQPGCPNLFWSLVELPNPPFSIARGYEGERMFLAADLDYLLTLDRPLTEAEVVKATDFLAEIGKNEGPNKAKQAGEAGTRLGVLAADPKRVEVARQRLLTVGKMTPAAVKSFTPLQVTLTDDVLSYNVLRDEFMKYRNLPFAESMAGLIEMQTQMEARRGDLVVAPLLMTTFGRIKVAEVRLAQRVGYLRVLEAIRMHATTNGGQLPETLDAIKLPMPLDPVTGKAFDYSVKDGVATLSGGKIAEQPQRVYEVRLRK